MLNILSIITPIFTVMLVGYIAGRKNFLGTTAVSSINRLIYYILLPALIFDLTSKTGIEQLTRFDFVLLFMVASLLTIVVCALGLLFFRGKRRREKTLFLMSSTIGNTAYLGIPLLVGIFGEIGGIAAITGSIMVNTVLSVITVCLIGFFAEDSTTPWQNIKNTLRNPFVISGILGIACAFSEIELPQFISKTASLLGSPTIGLALFTLGLSLANITPAKSTISEALWISGIKLLISPLLVVLLFPLFPELDPTWKACAVLLAATPLANNNYLFATSAGCYVQETVTAILVSTTASVVTLSVFIHFFG